MDFSYEEKFLRFSFPTIDVSNRKVFSGCRTEKNFVEFPEEILDNGNTKQKSPGSQLESFRYAQVRNLRRKSST